MASILSPHSQKTPTSFDVFERLGNKCFVRLRNGRWGPYKAGYNIPYPPGPPERNLSSGNRGDIQTTDPWITYREWGNLYDKCITWSWKFQLKYLRECEIVHLRIFGQHTIILRWWPISIPNMHMD
ncbi:hypothetical protein CVT25_009339 [Psilocybe cyanescens]|uniref:Uncharacterized protein n=1 Tax=Psilocybe cyanescens TaxID=93625 RepID=A0A409VNA9_PSICY|nr:hypothetical protein CVT25_009339 [Psilocybe cyanescens]